MKCYVMNDKVYAYLLIPVDSYGIQSVADIFLLYRYNTIYL